MKLSNSVSNVGPLFDIIDFILLTIFYIFLFLFIIYNTVCYKGRESERDCI